jgi:hypothetical protein
MKPARGNVARQVSIAVVVVATLAYYFWTASIPSGGVSPIHGRESDHFNLLSRGFKNGHLYLDREVPPEIINAPNPYDPRLREKVPVLHDASYFRGKYYLYFGPAPVVTLFLPFNLITGRDLPLSHAVWFFSSLGYLALIGIFLTLQRHHYPGASLCTIIAGLIALGGASMVVALLRRASVWETSAAAGFCYFSFSLYCLVRALHSRRATAWAIGGGLALGLAVASRPSYIICSILFALPLLFRAPKSERGTSYSWPALLGAAASSTGPVLALLAYNYGRFGDALEFGVTYQLTSVIESESRHFSLTYAWVNFRIYFLSALRWLPYFPFANGIVLPPLPPGHGGYEYTFGLFANFPFSWFGAAMLAGACAARRRADSRRGLWLSTGVITGAAVLNAGFLLCFFGSCIRYMVDFTPWFMLLASLGLIDLDERLHAGITRQVVRAGGVVLAVLSAAIAAAAIVNFYDPERRPPEAYRPVARALNFPFFWMQQQRWPDYQPLELSLSLPPDRTPRQEVLTSVVGRRGTTTAAVLIEYLAGDKIRLGYQEPTTGQPIVFSPAVAAFGGGTHTLRLSIGGAYSDFNGSRGRLRAQFDNVPIWDAPVVSFGTYPGELVVGADAAFTSNPIGFTGEIHTKRPVMMPALDHPRVSGVRVRLTFGPAMAGRSFPLVTTGRTKAGDILCVRMGRDGTITFGYDHWGDALLISPPIPMRPGETRVVEFWVPALTKTKPRLVIKVDGVTVWQRDASAFAFASENVFLGGNPIHASTCESVLENGIFEELQLPPPQP